MTKDISKIRIWVLILGVLLFTVLAISTVVERDLDEDYIGFQMFASQLKTNRFMFTDENYLQDERKRENLNTIIHELDLSFYIFKDSSIFSIYRLVNRPYKNSITHLEEKWEIFTTSYFSIDGNLSPDFKESLSNTISATRQLNEIIGSFEHRWSIYYTIVLALNLLAFLSLLVRVFIISHKKDNLGSSGIMSVRNALIEGQEQERLRISLELHDKVAQDLFAAKMLINDISSTTEDESISSSIIKSLTLLDASIKEVRDLSYSLRPPALQAIGLDSAIQSYIDNFSGKIEIPITFKAVGITNKNIDETVSINLYRILQETLNNTSKHAHAENIDVKLIYTYPYLLLKIEDDGVGFKYVKSETKARGRNKLGLPGIYERVSLLGGELIINTNKGEGTKILIKVPVAQYEKV